MTALHTIHHKLKTTEVLQYKQHKIRDLINFLKFMRITGSKVLLRTVLR